MGRLPLTCVKRLVICPAAMDAMATFRFGGVPSSRMTRSSPSAAIGDAVSSSVSMNGIGFPRGVVTMTRSRPPARVASRTRPLEAAVEELDGAIRRAFDVGGLEVAVDDASVVGRFEAHGDLFRNHDRLVDRNWPFSDAIGERWSLDQLEHERERAVPGEGGLPDKSPETD